MDTIGIELDTGEFDIRTQALEIPGCMAVGSLLVVYSVP